VTGGAGGQSTSGGVAGAGASESYYQDGGTNPATAFGSGPGAVSVTASATGGAGGEGDKGANGGAGGVAALVGAVSGSTTGSLTLNQSATGGAGGAAYGGGKGGAGGSADSELEYTDSSASVLSASLNATGGAGGATDTGAPGAGGAASVILTTTSTSATSVTGSATANGGAGGVSTMTAAYGAGGAASAAVVVSAAASGASGNAVAAATSGYGSGPETANALASVTHAASGSAQATSESQGALGTVITTATAPVGGPATAVTEANINSPLEAVALTEGEVYAAAELTPGGPNFGVGGFGAESDGSDTSLSYDATAELTFLTTTTGNVYLNLISGTPSGDAFQSLVFTYSIDGSTPVVETFATVAAADAFFSGNPINLGDLTAGTQTLDLSYAFTAMGDAPGYEVTFDTSRAPVPEPSTWAMMMLGFAGLGYASWRRGRKPSLLQGRLQPDRRAGR